MALGPNLRIVVDGDTSRPYREGDHVKGRVSLVLEQEERIKRLELSFFGKCTTKTTRPIYNSGTDDEACTSRRKYEENIRLFNFEKELAAKCNLAPNKYSWEFEFTFPSRTDAQFSRWAHGSKYLREPHPLPPTFQGYTNAPGGKATVGYYIEANLVTDGHKEIKATQMLGYLPSSRNTPREALITSRVLYAQTWKPTRKDSRTAVDKIFTKVSRKQPDSNTVARIIPTIYFPEKVAPGQHIPLLLCLAKAGTGEHPDCVLDSLTVNLSTYTTSMCGQPMTQPEDTVSKNVTCIYKQDMNQPLSFTTPTPLTNNFRLVDDSQCVPTFRTYTVTRRYTMTVIIGIKSQGQRFTVQSTSPLEILPRLPPSEMRGHPTDEDGDVDPLPLYMPREPSKEFAPDYEELYSLSPMPSTSVSLELRQTRSSSFLSTASVVSTAPTTPRSELDQPILERPVVQGR